MTQKYILSQCKILLFCIIAAFVFAFFFSKTLSPLYAIEGSDSTVFKIIGQVILRGKTPYVDIFDHKGPMLYFIQALGQWLVPGRRGLFFLTVIALAFSIFSWYKSARLFTSPIKTIITIILTLSTYYFFMEYGYGNLCEDWNIPFISFSYYLILSSLINNDDKILFSRCFIIGLCLSCSFFIRPNDAVAFIGFPILGLNTWFVKNKKFEDSIKLVEGVLVGFASVTIVFIFWFASKHALYDLWYGLIKYNVQYSTGIIGLLTGCVKIPKISYLPFLTTLLILSYTFPKSQFLYIFIPTTIAAYILLGNYAFPHYWIAWIPVIFFSFWLLLVAHPTKTFSILAFCVFISLPMFTERNWLKTPLRVYKEILRDIETKNWVAENSKSLFSSMNKTERDSIWSYNCTWNGTEGTNTFNVLLYNNIIPCNRVPLIFMADIDTTLRQYMDIAAYKPKYILFSGDNPLPPSYATSDSLYISEYYTVLRTCENPHLILYLRNEKKSSIFVKKY